MRRFKECPCCNEKSDFVVMYSNANALTLKDSRSFFFGSRNYIRDLLMCPKCGFHFQNTLPARYQDFYVSQDIEPIGSYSDFKVRYFASLRRTINNNPLFDDSKVESILDLGAGDGAWLDQWKDVSGRFATELSDSLVQRLITAKVKVLKPEDWKNRTYSVVSLQDYLEHVEDPKDYLSKAVQCVEKSGYLILSVPNMGALLPKLLGTKYYLYCPMHFSYFTKDSLFKLLANFFDKSKIAIFKAPAHKFSLKMATRWVSASHLVPKRFDFTFPIGYSANLVAICKK